MCNVLTNKHLRYFVVLRRCNWCTTAKMSTNNYKSAGIIIIGDEILKGQTVDINSSYLCKFLHSHGISVKKISVIGDDVEVISSEVQQFSLNYDFVLTSGGIGPTHDDMTLEGVAHAVGEELVPHRTLVELCKEFLGRGLNSWYFGEKPLSSPEMKLAHAPQSAKINFALDSLKGEKLKFPLVSVKNIYVFPGIPILLQKLIQSLGHLFKTENKFHSQVILVDALETEIAAIITLCADKYKDKGINIGSYPDWSNNYYKVKLVLESTNMDATNTAANFLKENIKSSLIVNNFVENAIGQNTKDIILSLFSSNNIISGKINNAMNTIMKALDEYQYDEICIGFNGGKDCTALLHLYYTAIKSKFPHSKELKAVYIKDKHPFKELEKFMDESAIRYNLHLISLDGNMQTALETLKSSHPRIKAVLMGTRCTDPYSKNLSAFHSTDQGWPKFMRINPLLDWTYHEIWQFLRTLYLPYCVLYDRGYTSLGSRESTKKNEKLVILDKLGNKIYKQAYTLKDQDMERNGRL